MTQPLDADSAHDADTIEMELSAEQLFTLTQAAAPDESEAAPEESEVAPAPAAESVAPATQAVEVAALESSRAPNPPTRDRLPVVAYASSPSGVVLPGRASRGRWAAPIVTIAAAAIAISVVAYFATTRKPPPPLHIAAHTAFVSAAPEAATPPAPQSVPVVFRNPFDAAEVFEFPSGTSVAEARDAVARILLERARERQVARAKPTPTTVASNKLVQRD